jgi:ATP/ADP translocase/HEAT repeat protein
MLTKKFWLRLLNVDQGEWWVVKNLMLLQFLQGAGIAFFFTASFAGFLERFPITELPWVMIAAAFMLWITGFVYTKAEHALPFPKLIIGVTLLMASSFIFFRLVGYSSTTGTYLYWMLAWFHTLYLLNNLQFWGIATIVFDLRQSKRLFGLISSGDIPAKFIGYTLASFIVPYTGTMNMLYLGAGCLLGSIPFILKIINTGKLHIEHDHHHKDQHHHTHETVNHGTSKIIYLLKNFLNNTFIRDIAFISMLAFICVLLVDYGFYSKVKQAVTDDVDLAKFIASFMAILRVSALLAKMIFTGRLTNSLGVRQTLLIMPTMLIMLILTIIVSQWFSANQKVLFYLFGATAILVDVSRTVFNSPVLLTLMQPLPTHERLRAHSIVKGIMDPFAYLITGSLLLLLFWIQKDFSLITMCYVILGICCLWIPGIYAVNKRYLNILVQTISSRYFSQEEFSLKDEGILQAIRKKISSGNDLEVISILKMLQSKKDPVAEDLLGQLLNHPSSQVQFETLRLISGQQPESLKTKLSELANMRENTEMRNEAIKTLSKISILAGEVQDYLEHEEPGIRKAALCGMLMNQEMYIRDIAQEHLEKLVRSSNKYDKFFATHILEEVKDSYNHPMTHRLITDPDQQVQGMAIKAIGKAASPRTLKAVMEVLPDHAKTGLLALQNAGEAAVDVISEALKLDRFKLWHEKFYLILGRIGGKKAQEVLASQLEKDSFHLAPVIKALYRTKYKADEETLKRMEVLAKQYLVYGVEMLNMQKLMRERGGYDILERSIELEIQEIRDLLLSLFACMFDRTKMNQARKGLDSQNNENMANAMELIELTVKRDIGRHFNHMFETTSLQHRCNSLRALLKDVDFNQVDHIIMKVLKEKPIQYQNWTKACSLYITKKYLFAIDPQLINPYSQAENRMVRETARFALANP